MKNFFYASLLLVSLIFTFGYGVGVGTYKWFPYDLIKQVKFLASGKFLQEVDALGRLVHSSKHTEVNCPEQNERVGVLVAFGQSNSANSAEYKFSTDELNGVFNYFNGSCYLAQSPLLGATGGAGEWITLTSKKLIEEDVYDKVIVVSSGIGGSPIERWADGNDLNSMLVEVLQTLQNDYRVTDMIWHQGESDRVNTHTEVYETYFMSMMDSIRDAGINASIFMSVASICGEEGSWAYPNRVSNAQTRLVDVDGVELGVNTDELVPIQLRYDNCHFAKAGQEVAASELAQRIAKFHATEQ